MPGMERNIMKRVELFKVRIGSIVLLAGRYRHWWRRKMYLRLCETILRDRNETRRREQKKGAFQR